jgi:anti-sigma B factor antagonist
VKIDVRQEGEVAIVAPVGPLIIGASERLMNETIARLFADRKFHIVIDMAGVPRIDSSGVDTLVLACRRARENGGDARLARVVPRIHQLLEITQLTTVFDIYPDLAQATGPWTNSRAGS